jgi:UDP-glucose 4-epimerase
VNVLVVGAAGFLGSHLTERLVAERHAVDAIDDLSSGSLGNLADARSLGGDLRIHTIDAAGSDFATLVMHRQPSLIYHLGWLPPGRTTAAAAAAGLHSMLNVLDAAAQLGGVKVVTALPSVSLYGEVPLRDVPVKEGRAHQPASLHGVVAEAVLNLLALYRRDHAVEYTALLLANVYGPRQRADGGVVASFAAARREHKPATIHGDGRQTRDFLYVDDAVDALVRAALKGDGLSMNVGTAIATSVRDLWDMMAGPGAPPPVADDRPGGVTRSALAVTRARIHLGWAPWTDLASGLRSL